MTKDFSTPTVTEPPTFSDEQSNVHVKQKATNFDFPEQPLGQRIIVKPRELEMEYEKVESGVIGGGSVYRAKKSGVMVPEKEVEKLMMEIQRIPQLVDVIAVGPEVGISPMLSINPCVKIVPGDVIRVFLNQCDGGKITINDEDYLVFSERNVITKVK